MSAPVVILAVGGVDGSGGAGTLADARAIQLNGGYPCTVVTAVTAQNTVGVDRVEPLSSDLIRDQLQALTRDFQISAIKVGLLPSLESVEAVVDTLHELSFDGPIVVDPVSFASSGHQLAESTAVAASVEKLLPRATLITPNVEETNVLANSTIFDIESAIDAGKCLLELGCEHVIVKGGHQKDEVGSDVWCHSDGFEIFKPRTRYEGTVRGTGCMFASAIACHLGQGRTMRDAIERAKVFISEVFAAGEQLGKGTPLTTAGINQTTP